jgi:hypothetical protein
MKRKNLPEEKKFIVLNKDAFVWCGLRGGKAEFSSDYNMAKPLYRIEQFESLKMVSDDRELEIIWI